MKEDLEAANAAGYTVLVAGLKQRIRTARLCATVAVNQELIRLYWGLRARHPLATGWLGNRGHGATVKGPAAGLP